MSAPSLLGMLSFLGAVRGTKNRQFLALIDRSLLVPASSHSVQIAVFVSSVSASVRAQATKMLPTGRSTMQGKVMSPSTR